jgi:cold shock CspA family protein/ribosome-associated translation inhibitor RaiA
MDGVFERSTAPDGADGVNVQNVKELMSGDPISLGAGASAAEAYEAMLRHGIRHPWSWHTACTGSSRRTNAAEETTTMQLHWHRPELFPERDRELAEERIHGLAHGYADLIDVRISASTTQHHRHGGQEVRITCEARGKEIVAARTRPDAGQALNEALDAFEREVHRMRERRTDQRRERPAEPPELGVIERIPTQGDHGFLVTDAGLRVYFHRNAVRGLDFADLSEGQRVALNFEAGDEGPQATFVGPPPPGVTP